MDYTSVFLLITLRSYTLGALILGIPTMPILVTPEGPPIKGALIEDYHDETLIIKVTSPSDIIKEVLKQIDPAKTPQGTSISDIKQSLGHLEVTYEKRFNDIFTTFQQTIATPSLVKRDSASLQEDFGPIAQVYRKQKQTRNGIVFKGIQYDDYESTTVAFAYENLVTYGAVPDKKYEELVNQITILHELREQDLLILDTITLVSTQLNSIITDAVSEFHEMIRNAKNTTSMQIQGCIILTNYLDNTQLSLLLLLNGKLSPTLIGLGNQHLWLRKKVKAALVHYIGSISPHLKIKLKAIDAVNHQIIIKVSIPELDSRFSLQIYDRWKPEVIIDNTCYSAPASYYYVAYPLQHQGQAIIEHPLLIDPSSCLDDGFIMCKSDAILRTISGLTQNNICTNYYKSQSSIRRRRSTDNIYEAPNPVYELTDLITNTINTRGNKDELSSKVIQVQKELDQINQKAKEMEESSLAALKKASVDHRILKFQILIGLIFFFIMIWAIAYACSCWENYKKKIQLRNSTDCHNIVL